MIAIYIGNHLSVDYFFRCVLSFLFLNIKEVFDFMHRSIDASSKLSGFRFSDFTSRIKNWKLSVGFIKKGGKPP